MPRGLCWVAAALLIVHAGCLDARSSPCGDGRVCAPGSVCVAALDLCAAPDQLAACASSVEGDRCATASIPFGICASGACVGAGCGNGIVELGEACDDGNRAAGDGCSADCVSTEVCGNGIADRDEQCDCGTLDAINPACVGPNSELSGACNLACKLRCGDGVVSPDEGCDPGVSDVVSCAGAVYDRGLTTCSASCQPVMASDTCRYLGWRTRSVQGTSVLVIDVAPTSATAGFFINSLGASTFTNYNVAGALHASASPLRAVWALDDAVAVAVGDAGTTLIWNQQGWELHDAGGIDLRDVWGRAANDVYAIGASTVIHWNGSTWTALPAPAGEYRAIAGDADHVYLVGDQGLIVVYDGTTWRIDAAGTAVDLRGVWFAGGRVVAVGDAGTILEHGGGGWVRGRTSATVDLRGVWGSDVDGFFAAGDRGTVLFFDGRVWRPLALGRGVTGPQNQPFFQVAGVRGMGVAVIGTYDVIGYEGAAWVPTTLPTSETLHGLWASGPDDVFAVGRNGTIVHHDGLRWELQPTPTSVDLRAVWGTAPDDVYAAGDDLTLLHYDGSAWSILSEDPGAGGDFAAVFASAPDRVVAAGTTGIYHYDGVMLDRVSTTAVRTLWGASSSQIWAGGQKVLAFDGSAWIATEADEPVYALAGTSATDVWAVGPNSYRFDGTSWQPGPFADDQLAAVCTAPGLGAFVAGSHGALRHWNGSVVEPFVSRTTADLDALLITGNVVFMAGVDGTLDVLVFHR